MLALTRVGHAVMVQHVLVEDHTLTSVIWQVVDIQHRRVLIRLEVKVVGALVRDLNLRCREFLADDACGVPSAPVARVVGVPAVPTAVLA